MEWKQGKDHMIPDCLSRAPVCVPETNEMLAEIDEFSGPKSTIYSIELEDPSLRAIAEIAKNDSEYQELKRYVMEGFPENKESLPAALHPYWKLKNLLTVEDDMVLKGYQLVIPRAARKEVLIQLHKSHQGIEKTKRRARQTVFWPAISSDIQNIVEACKLCQELRPSIQKEPLMNDPLPDRPFVDVSMDLFSTGGKNFMVYVDRLSGWPIIVQFGTRCPNSAAVINSLRRIFSDTGIPIRIRCDGGPQFSSLEFKEFLRKWKINMSPSSPHFPQSNGHAEAAVKVMKSLILKCTKNGVLDEEEYHAGLLEFRNTPTSTGYSPSQLLTGRPLRSLVPAHRRSFSRNWLDAANQIDRDHQRNLVAEQFNKNAKNLNPLDVGTNVRIQNPSTKKWDMTGIIVDRGEYRKYTIKCPSGRVLIRNRRFLKRTQEG
ncbi:unnamed protein product, partial [Nesidiocoris tenuis]